MASYCPKCGYKLSVVDIKPECPVCGVNLVYYGMEDSLKKEADKAEFEHATFQPHLDRLKAATIGSGISKIRIAICLLPLLATLLPMGKITVNLPSFTENVTVNIVSVIQKVFMNLDFDYLLAMINNHTVGKAYICYAVAVVSFIMIVLMWLLNIVNLFMACGKRGIRRNITVASIGLGFTLVGGIALELWLSLLTKAVPEIFSGSIVIWGILGVAVAFIAEIIINIIYKKKNIKVKYTDVSQFLIDFDKREKKPEDDAVVVKAEG